MEISAQVICIGNEIMLGHIANTNAQYISNKLTKIGIKTNRHIDVPDNPETIISTIRKALDESEIVILSGGLGPTVDDLTLECVAKALNKKLIFDKKIAGQIKGHFKSRHIKMPENNLRQALLPEGTIPIPNHIGTAPGLIIPVNQSLLIALPGVPYELYPMFEKTVLPYLKKTFPTDRIIKSRLIKITGLPESKVNEIIEDILRLSGNVQMGIYPHPEEIHVKITVTEKDGKSADSVINKLQKKIEARLKKYIFGYDNEKLEEVVAKNLLKTKKTLAIAESCTGGLLTNRITDIPGSSKYFKMGIVAYSNESKTKLLNIPLEIIKKYSAVSEEVTILMAKNIRMLAQTDIGIGISGIAGPKGGSKKKPVGLVYIALSTVGAGFKPGPTICKEFRFIGTRALIKYKSTQAALNMIRQENSSFPRNNS